MTLVRYQRHNQQHNNNWNALNLFHDQFRHQLLNAVDNETHDVATRNWTPAVDIKEQENNFVIYADIPGVDPKDIEIQLADGVLTIKGERQTQRSTENEDSEESKKNRVQENYKRVERSNGSFYRRFSLPDSADSENITAKSVNGVLELTIAKTEKVKPRKIEINS